MKQETNNSLAVTLVETNNSLAVTLVETNNSLAVTLVETNNSHAVTLVETTHGNRKNGCGNAVDMKGYYGRVLVSCS